MVKTKCRRSKWLIVLLFPILLLACSRSQNDQANNSGDGSKNKTTDYLVNELDSGEFSKQIKAIRALGEMGREAKAAVPNLTKLVNGHDEELRGEAIVALGKTGPEAKDAIPALIGAQRDKDNEIRRLTSVAVAQIGTEAIPDLIRVLKDKNEWVSVGTEETATGEKIERRVNIRSEASSALQGIGKPSVPFLIELLNESDPSIRRVAILTLGKIGSIAKDAVPSLTKSLRDDNEAVRKEAGFALSRIESTQHK